MDYVNSSDCQTIDPKKSIIVVSDLHLGAMSGERTSNDFSLFLDWLEELCTNKNNVVICGKKEPVTLKPPELLILLGDILDFWVQRESLRKSLLSDSFPVLTKLRNLPVSIVYVIGNHDREVYEVNGIITTEENRKIIIEPDQFPHTQNAGDPLNACGLLLGKFEYIFLHGHQFDKQFRLAQSLSEFPGWVSNNSAVFIAHPWFRRISWFFFFFGMGYLVLSGLGFLPAIHPIVDSVILVLFGISVPLFFISIPSDWLRSFYIAVSNNPAGKRIQAFINILFHPERGKRIDELIALRKYKGKRDIEGTKVVVFGHTHMPDDYNDLELNKRFINSGSWDHERPAVINNKDSLQYHIIGKEPDLVLNEDGKSTLPPAKKFVWNSFIYIDEKGPRPFVWCVDDAQKGTAHCLQIGGDSSQPQKFFIPL